jgi:hypothetical protein
MLFTYNYRRHAYHIVNKSPWPILLSFSLFSFIISNLCLLHNYSNEPLSSLYINFFLVVTIMFLWWRDVIRDGFFEGCHTKVVMYGLRLGMALFIVSEVMFFLAFFWAFFHSSLAPVVQIGCVWPPVDYPVIDPFAIPFFNTIILVFSGLTLTLAHLTFLSHEDIVKKERSILDNVLPLKYIYDPLFDVFFFFLV